MNKTSLSKICIYFIRIPKSYRNMRILIIFSILITSCLSNTNKTSEISNSMQNNVDVNSKNKTIYNFTEQGKGKWRVQDDVVMGGRSDSQLKMTDEKQAHFSGRVSLENNGGFCSIHQTTEKTPYVIDKNSVAFVLFIKGDGKNYNFRVRTPNGKHAYAFTFSTKAEEWEKIAIPFNEMEATFRGESIDVPNYAGENIVEMQLLIGNKKEENFEILIESVAVKS